MGTVAIETYGCTLNHADSDIMSTLLESGQIGIEKPKGAIPESDYVIINTCTVKKVTEQKILHRLSKLDSAGKKLIITGCMVGADSKKLSGLFPNASLISPSNIGSIGNIMKELQSGTASSNLDYSKVDKLSYPLRNEGVIARIPISEGCLSNCSFCETKFARGPLNSFSQELILKAVSIAVEKGAREIELTSQDVGAYGTDRKTNIVKLLNEVCNIEGDFMVRVGMLNPEHLHKYIDGLVESMKDEKVYSFIHLPVQSGSNPVLKSMERNYTIEEFEGYVKQIRKHIGDISIATDVIIGFPTETDDDFNQTIEMLERIRPAFTNVSKFGMRPHTRASKMKQINNKTVKQRSTDASRVARQLQKEDLSKKLNSVEKIVITETKGDSLIGRDKYYRNVVLNNTKNISVGDKLHVKIKSNSSVCLLAEPVIIL